MGEFEISLENQEFEITPHLGLIPVSDGLMGITLYNIGLYFTYTELGEERMWGNFTVNFQEFIGIKNSAYIDTNNCWYAEQILETGIAKNTGFKKISGNFEYPLWVFDEAFLKGIDAETYRKYSKEYDEYVESMMGYCDEEQTLKM